MTLKQLLIILVSRWKLLLLSLLVTVGSATALTLLLPKTYTATTDVIVDVRSPDPIAGIVLPGLATPGYMATQVDVILSDRVARKVIAQLKLDQAPSLHDDWVSATNGEGAIVNWLVDILQKRLEVKPSRESNVIRISYSSPDPEFSAALANAFASAFIETNVELRAEPAKEYNKWFQEQASQARASLEKAQLKLSAYQKEKGVLITDNRLDAELNKLNELSSQLSLVQGQYADAASKQKSVDSLESLPEVIQNPLIQNLKSEISRLDAQLQDASNNLGKNHPTYLQIHSKIVSMRERLAFETRRIAQSIVTTSEVAKAKEQELLSAIDSQRQNIINLRSEQDALSVMQREVDAAQRAYDAITVRVTQSMLESQATQTNAAVLTVAEAPYKASSPKILLNLVLSVFLGGLLGVTSALLIELNARKIRSIDDLKSISATAILVDLPERPINFKVQSDRRKTELSSAKGQPVPVISITADSDAK